MAAHKRPNATYLTAVMACLTLIGAILAQGPDVAKEPNQAMVRIKSHGASGTVIATREGKSWILGCAHMIMDRHQQLDEAALKKILRMDGPPQPRARQAPANAKIIAHDLNLDLSLIEIDNGPFNCIPVAPKGFKPGRNIQSLEPVMHY